MGKKNRQIIKKKRQNPGRSTIYSSKFIMQIIHLIKALSRMINQQDDFLRRSAFRKLEVQSTQFSSQENQLGVTNEMMQVINAQNILIMKLLQRQNTLYQELNKKFTSSDSGQGSMDKQNKYMKADGGSQYNNLQQFSSSSNRSGNENQPKNHAGLSQKQNSLVNFLNPSKSINFKCEVNSSPQHAPDISDFKQEKNSEKKKQTQTKNMIKNFAKAIFGFIRKNRARRVQILEYLSISQEEFMAVLDSFKGHIHSISQLRSLWTSEGNVYHKAFRMLSCEYLRKHCLQKTFNSRVQNYSVHLKYRQRLFDGLKDPEKFTALKTN